VQEKTVENYLKTIYHLSSSGSLMVTNKQLATRMEVIPATITETLRKLNEMRLVDYEKSYGARLTPKGLKQALAIVRRHRIWETYLAQELGFGWDEVHEIAEELEHVVNEKLILRLHQKIGEPMFDPHGDPIPDEKGKIQKMEFIKLSDCKAGRSYVFCGVSDHSASFLNYLDRNKLKIGNRVEVLERESFDGSVLVKRGDGKIQLSLQIAMNMLLRTKD